MTRRDQIVVAVVLAVAAVVGAWLLVIQPKRSQASKLGSQISAVQSQLDQARTQVAQGEAARARFSGSYTVLARLGEAVPADDNVPSLIYEIQDAATKAHVDFDALTLAPTGSSTTPSTSSLTATSSTSARSAAPAPSLPPGVAIGPAGFPIEPFSFTFSGNFFHLSDFFGRLERFVSANNRNISVSGRLMTLDAISLAPGGSGFPTISATVSATTYLLPASEGLTAGATPAGPAPQTVSTTASASSAPPAVVTPPVR